MTSGLRELPLSYAVLSEGRRCGSASAVHEPNPAGPLTRQLLAQHGDRLICVRYRWSSSPPNAMGNRHGLASPTTRSSGYASPLPTWRCATG